MKVLKHPLLLLLAVSSLASCGPVKNFMDARAGCRQFFLNGRFPPTILRNGNRYQQICQVYRGAPRFATLYDTVNRIPVYSAYLHVPHVLIPRPNNWRTEPGLVDAQQATDADYTNSGYDRGHLYGAYNNNNPDGVAATFTLTNAAPQIHSFNVQWYNAVEEPLNRYITANCGGNPGYIVTGVVPGVNLINNRVRVADRFWTAYCCRDNNGVVRAGAFLMDQTGRLILNNANVRILENHLNNVYYNGPFQVFGGQCYN